jgi:hypothetical protein
MSFGIPDLAATVIIQDALDFLSKNPKHLEFILSMYCRYPRLQKFVGTKHLKDCMDYILENRIEVGPFYQVDIKRRPSISIVSSGAESQQFLGDYGTQQQQQKILPPLIYADFDATKIKGDTLTVPAGYKLESILWHGVFIANGTEIFKLEGIVAKAGKPTVLCLDREIPEGTSLKGWRACSDDRKKGYVINASIDDITIQLKLSTNGDFVIHRLLVILLRYCIKSRRMEFDNYGIQVASVNFSPPMLTDPDEMEFESVFTLSAKFTDHWIEKEFDLPDAAAKIDIGLIASSVDEENQDVELE